MTGTDAPADGLTRRGFLQAGGSLGLGLGVAPAALAAPAGRAWPEARDVELVFQLPAAAGTRAGQAADRPAR
jgi:hypothetical protein